MVKIIRTCDICKNTIPVNCHSTLEFVQGGMGIKKDLCLTCATQIYNTFFKEEEDKNETDN